EARRVFRAWQRRDGRLPATFEIVYGHAWKAAPKATADGHAIVRFRK
ncbi:MAG: malonyl-[acyl-carrier protein] O-methyltransferase BioC, partial [Rhodocyclaceae bacterium]|nr:malonyl-[acyl-carrier protein] O-methyltransferase BioC [Rhodocyclaceae bacterium]